MEAYIEALELSPMGEIIRGSQPGVACNVVSIICYREDKKRRKGIA